MTEAAAVDRKKRVRAAHRGQVTRIIGEVQGNLGSEGGPNVPKLRLQRKSLMDKKELLSRLDEELTDLVELDELEREIEQIDLVREKIEITVLDIDLVLKPEGH